MTGRAPVPGDGALKAKRRPHVWARVPTSTLLAWRNLIHDRSRLYVAVAGIGFSVLLMSIQVSLMLGFTETAAGLVNNGAADLWVCGRGIKNVDQMPVIPKRWRYDVLAVPGVAEAQPYLVRFTLLRAPDGRTESVVAVGYEPGGLGGPWNLVAGGTGRLQQGGVIIDDLYRRKLGIDRLERRVEVGGVQARVVGFTRGVRTFVQSPYVFASFPLAQRMSGLRGDEATCVLATLEDGADPVATRDRVRTRLPYSDTYLKAEFSRRTTAYWLVSTGIGLYLLLGSALGLIVGAVIAAQTLYASASDHLPEFATLRAMGATDRYMRSLVLQQAAMSAVLGYLAGITVAVSMIAVFGEGLVALRLPMGTALGLGGVTVVMCLLAGLVAIGRVLRVNPTSIFR